MTVEGIIKNQGATLTKTLRKSSLKSGFMVSLEGYEIILKTSQRTKIFREIKRANKKSKKFPNSYVGVWIEKGQAYIDVSLNIKDKNKAIEFGKKNKQLAIYDIKNNEVITL